MGVIKNSINIILLSIVFTSCNQTDSLIDISNLDHIIFYEYVQHDSTIITDDFNSEKELIGVYDVGYIMAHLIIFIFSILVGIFIGKKLSRIF